MRKSPGQYYEIKYNDSALYVQASISVLLIQMYAVQLSLFDTLGAVSIRKTVLPGMAIPMLKIRRPNGRLIFNMEIAIRR